MVRPRSAPARSSSSGLHGEITCACAFTTSTGGDVRRGTTLTLRILTSDPTANRRTALRRARCHRECADGRSARLRKAARTGCATVSWRTILCTRSASRVCARLSDKVAAACGQPFKMSSVRRRCSPNRQRQALADRVMEGLGLPAPTWVRPASSTRSAVKPEPYVPRGREETTGRGGYPNGFTMTLAAPNNRYINDEQIAQACVRCSPASGITTKVDSMRWRRTSGKCVTGVWRGASSRLGLRSRDRAPFARGNPECRDRSRHMELGAIFEPRAPTSSSSNRLRRSTGKT